MRTACVQVFTLGGSFSGVLGTDKGGEILTPPNGGPPTRGVEEWRRTTGIEAAPILSDDPQGDFRTDNYGFFFAWTGNSGAYLLGTAL